MRYNGLPKIIVTALVGVCLIGCNGSAGNGPTAPPVTTDTHLSPTSPAVTVTSVPTPSVTATAPPPLPTAPARATPTPSLAATAASTPPAPVPVGNIADRVAEAMRGATSYKKVSKTSTGTVITQVFVAPDRLATVIETKGIKRYMTIIGPATYASADGVQWTPSPVGVGDLLKEFNQRGFPPGATITAQPDETFDGKTVGVFSVDLRTASDPLYAATGATEVVRYDKATYLIIAESGTSSVTGAPVMTESRYSDYNSPANRVEPPL